MIENELRTLLADRAGTVGDNAARVGEVHARIAQVRRRRAAGAALALVLLALAGLALLRLPGHPESLPTGSPAGPYFGEDGSSRSVEGYTGTAYFRFRGAARWSVPATVTGVRHVLVARCAERGDLRLANPRAGGPDLVLRCRVPVAGHYEGALPLDEPSYARLVDTAAPGPADVDLRPGPGDWSIGMLGALFPDRISAAVVAGSLIDGFRSPAGGRVQVTVPTELSTTRVLVMTLVCVRGVQLEFTVDGRPAGVASCDDAHVSGPGLVSWAIVDSDLQRLGVRPGKRVSLGVRPVRPTDQWAVLSLS